MNKDDVNLDDTVNETIDIENQSDDDSDEEGRHKKQDPIKIKVNKQKQEQYIINRINVMKNECSSQVRIFKFKAYIFRSLNWLTSMLTIVISLFVGSSTFISDSLGRYASFIAFVVVFINIAREVLMLNTRGLYYRAAQQKIQKIKRSVDKLDISDKVGMTIENVDRIENKIEKVEDSVFKYAYSPGKYTKT